MQPCLVPILEIELQTVAARTSEEVGGGARFSPDLSTPNRNVLV